MTAGRREVVLIGGGHAHLQVLEALAERPWRRGHATLISLSRHHHYSGMVPGYLEGRYAEPELRFDLAALCRAADVQFVEGRAERIASAERFVEVDDGARLPFDVLSLDVGSAPSGISIPGVAEHAFTVRPMSRAVQLGAALDGRIDEGGAVRVAVVGAGAAGFEIALTIEARVARAGALPEVHLVERAQEILPGTPDRVRRVAGQLLEARGVHVRTDVDIVEVRSDGLRNADGRFLDVDLVVWVAGAAAPPLIEASAGLPRDPDGFLKVDETLRAVDGTPVWGAGDCIALAGHPDMPRAGVYAVRQGPVLEENLRRAAESDDVRDPERYSPQPGFLSLMNTGDGRALLHWRSLAIHSRLGLRLKDWIDRRFMRRFHRIEPDGRDDADRNRPPRTPVVPTA